MLARCDEFGPQGAELREHLGDAHLTSIECAGPLVWVPVAADIELQAGLASVLGREQAQQFLRASLREVWTGSVLQPLVRTAVGIFGLHPGSLARLVPAAWSLLYRDCGSWIVHEPPANAPSDRGKSVELRLDGLPEACARAKPWLAAVATILHALLILCDVAGEVELLEGEAGSGAARFRLCWV